MSEVAVAEVEAATPPSEAGTPVSPEPTTPPSEPEETPESAGTETPEPEGAPEPEPDAEAREALAPTPEGRLAQLEAKGEREGLTPTETTELKRVQQSVTDRRIANQNELARLRNEAAQREQLLAQSRPWLEGQLNEIWQQNDGTQNGNALAIERQQKLLGQYHGWAESIYQQPLVGAVERQIANLRGGDSVELRNWLTNPQVTWEHKLNQLVLEAEARGRKQGPGEDAIVFKTKSELAKHDADVKKAAEDALKAANPQIAVGTGNGHRSNGGSRTYSQMTTEEREALSPADRDRLVAEQYSRS